MKIAIINAHYSEILGGSEIQCHQIAQGLTELGIDLAYIAVGGYDEVLNLPYKLISVEKNSSSIIKAIKPITRSIKTLPNKKGLVSFLSKLWA